MFNAREPRSFARVSPLWRKQAGPTLAQDDAGFSPIYLPIMLIETKTSDRPGWELYSTCIHCGLCLNACPTYRVLGTEMDSPRGRIYQVAQVDLGKLPVAESFVTHIDRCLDCRACESACPSGVEYGRIVERARALIESEAPRWSLT